MIRTLTLYTLLLILLPLKAGIFDTLIPEELATGIEFSEGPAWHPDGYLLFSDVAGNKIYKWQDGNLEEFLSPSENANGIACSKENDFVVCRHSAHDVVRMDSEGQISTIVSEYQGKRLNSPNDVTLSYKGSIYFTDPDYGVSADNQELSFQGLYCIPNNTTDLILLDSTLVKPNGLTFSLDWRILYVNETSTNTIYTYFLRDESIIQDLSKDKQVFLELDDSGEIDGLTADVYGNLYVAFGDGGIKIFDKDAIEIGQITFPSKTKVRNLCFGGKYQNILFVTAGNSLYKVEIRYYDDLIAPGLLGVPTDKSVIFNALSDQKISAYLAYGENENSLNLQTESAEFEVETPIEISIEGLQANTRYYYELRYKKDGDTEYVSATAGTFITQRDKGETFSFAVEADPHLDESSNYTTFRNMLQNASDREADFLIDLGDNFMTEKFPIFDEYYVEQRNLLYRHFWDNVCRSMPLFIVNGNHEGELRWRDEMIEIANTTRKKYYPTPVPDDFYSGNTEVESAMGQRENYYAWHWGDALFVVIDPYGYVETRNNDPWCFTLGKTQYDWFRETLEESEAKYKFVFAHQLVGGDSYGRGGSEFVDLYEMGGYNDDSTYGFDKQRPGWGKPLHELMVDNGVQIYFHGHDHFYAEQEKDGLVYQLVPQPSFPGYIKVNDAEDYGYLDGIILPNSGHLQVSVDSDSAKVEYVGAYHIDNEKKGLVSGQTRRTYYVKPKSSETNAITSSEVSGDFEAYFSKNSIIVKSPCDINVNISLFTVDGKSYGIIFDGNMVAGDNRIPIKRKTRQGPHVLLIQSSHSRDSLKLMIEK